MCKKGGGKGNPIEGRLMVHRRLLVKKGVTLMCVTSAPADLSKTTVYTGDVDHPTLGRIRVLGYQNSVESLSGPNAMLLHIPAKEGMSQANFIDTTKCPHILDDMKEALTPKTRGIGFEPITRGMPKGILVFDVGSYTVVLTENARLIPDALLHVPANKRPTISSTLMDFYARTYPGWSIALCCFDNAQLLKAEPMLMWYKPMDEGVLRLPGLDCHTGDVPNLSAKVEVDHWVILGHPQGIPVYYLDNIPDDIRAYLPKRVVGERISGMYSNGDFVVDAKALSTFNADIERAALPTAGEHI